MYIYDSSKNYSFIIVIAPLTAQMVTRFKVVKPIGRPVPIDSQVFIPNEQAVDRFTWYSQAVNRFNLKFRFNSLKPDESLHFNPIVHAM